MSKLFLLLIAIAVLAIIYSFYLKAGKPTKKILLTSDIFIELDKGPVQEKINSIIPLKEVTPASTTTDTKADIEKQKELENKVKELEEQKKALRSEDGSIPADKISEFKRL
jgi:zona occludens toxin (predicted ATPase)